jgi:glutamine amidotransferase
MQAEQSGLELTTCIYGHSFAAGLAEGKVAGVQFHPEKSHVFGLELMKNFAAWK